MLKRYLSKSLGRQLQLTFFTKDGCKLCSDASSVLSKVIKDVARSDIDVKHLDIMSPENSEAFDKYCYDVPVLHIEAKGQKKPIKFMHYFDEKEIKKAIELKI